MVWACCCRSVDTRTYNAARICGSFLGYHRRRRPAQHQLVCLVPPVLPIWLLAGLPPDLEGAPHAALPLLTQSEGLHLPTTPQPQRPPPPRQPKLAVAGPAELVTCDQTIERLMGRRKQFRAVATRFDKLAVRYQATIAIADIFIWLRARPDSSRGDPRNTPQALSGGSAQAELVALRVLHH